MINSQYFFLFKNRRDGTGVKALFAQMYPGRWHYAMEAYEDVTEKAYGFPMIYTKKPPTTLGWWETMAPLTWWCTRRRIAIPKPYHDTMLLIPRVKLLLTGNTMTATLKRASLIRINRNKEALLTLQSASASLRRILIQTVKRDLVLALVEIAENIIKGNVKLTGAQLSGLKRKKKHVAALVNPKKTETEK